MANKIAYCDGLRTCFTSKIPSSIPLPQKKSGRQNLPAAVSLNCIYAFKLTLSCAFNAFSSFFKREALFLCERSFMNAFAST